MTSTRISRRWILKSCAAAVAAEAGAFPLRATASGLRVGAPAPAAVLVTLDGQIIKTADLLGHVVILTFWATWCVPCQSELPLLSGSATQHAGSGLQVLGFCLDSPDDLSKAHRIAQTLSFPVGMLANSQVAGYGRIWRLPVNFTIDRMGKLASDGWKEKEPSWTQESLDRIVTPLLE